jgi:two-component system, cell cycle sensor histidine kinase and response regulator CckA
MAEVSATAPARSPQSQADPRIQLLAQKNHLVSELAGAIDNQFNNVMMAVCSYAELELKKASSMEKRSLQQVLQNAGRATYLIQKLLAFSRNRTVSRQAADLNATITGLTELMQQLLGERIEIVLGLEPRLGKITADPIELEQLLLNLAIQVRDGISGSGKIVITTKSMDLDGTPLPTNRAKPGAKSTVLVVHGVSAAETGVLSAAVAAAHPAESLSLASIERVVKEFDGMMGSESAGNAGFAIYFRALEGNVPEKRESVAEKPSGSKTILVVEDDDAVRIPATEFLKMEGFKVLQAKTGPEAINIAMQKRSPLDLLITDIVMPAMNGREVAQELREMYPGLKVLYMSGDTHAAPPSQSGHQPDEMLQKPFRLDKLNEKIRSVLGE